MRLIWTPPEGEPREFIFKPYDLLSPDAEPLEAMGGDAWETYDQFVTLFNKGHRRALRAALWHLRKAEEPGLRFEQLAVRAGREVRIEPDDDDLADRRRRVLESPDFDDATRRELYEAFGGDPKDLDGPDPKASPSGSPRGRRRTPSGGGSTGGSSPESSASTP